MEHRERIWLADELGVEIEIEVEAAIRFGVINAAGHQDVGGIVVAFGFDETGVETGELGIGGLQGRGKHLEFFATASLNEAATDEVINDLAVLTWANGFHETGDPGTRIRLSERNAAAFEKVEHEFEMLQFFDGNGVEFFDAREQVAKFFEVERTGGGFALEMGVVHENRRQIRQDFRQPVGRNLFAE